jgi:hypothetical protein
MTEKKVSNTSQLERVYLLTYDQRISSFMDIFCPIIKIDESLQPTHLQNNRSVLNVWLGSSQKLGLQIYDNRSRSFCSPNDKFVGAKVGTANLVCICGHQIFWTPIIKKGGSTLGACFLGQSSSKSRSFLLSLYQ